MCKIDKNDQQNETHLSSERRMIVDDVCAHTISEAEMWRRARNYREARGEALHRAVIEAKARWDASGDPADEVAFNEAFELWIGA